MAQVLGILSAVWRGSAIQVEKGSTVKMGGLKQVSVITGKQVNYSEEFDAAEIEITTVLKRGDKLYDIFTAGQGELQIQCDTGQSYIWGDAFITNRPNFSSGDGGKVKVMFAGGDATEVLNG